jgi:hypothetical protein
MSLSWLIALVPFAALAASLREDGADLSGSPIKSISAPHRRVQLAVLEVRPIERLREGGRGPVVDAR